MIADIWTVIWKEGKEILAFMGGQGKWNRLIILGVLGVLIPLQMGKTWVESPIVLAYCVLIPLFLVSTIIADSFAGERERHTLKTLLASRLSDRAILFGKVFAAMGYGCVMTWISFLIGLVAINLVYGRVELLFYSPAVGIGIVGLSLLGGGLSASIGVLISLRAGTVRQAQQSLGVVNVILLLVPIFGIRALPIEWRTYLGEAIMPLDVVEGVILVIALLTVLDIALLIAAMTRFHRAQLIYS